MEREVKILKDLPLNDLISAPLNAVINAQAAAALTTVNFIERVGFINKSNPKKGIFDKPKNAGGDNYDVRVARLNMEKVEFVPAILDASGNVTTPATTKTTTEKIELPFLSLVPIPSFEVNQLDWDFNVKLNSVEEFSTDFTHSDTTTNNSDSNFGLNIGDFLSVGSTMKVQTTVKNDFELRYGSSHEAEYNLKIAIKATAAKTPLGIERLLGIAEKIATNNEQANSKLAAPK